MGGAANTYPRTEETFPGSLFGRPSRRSYRAAVKQIVLDVKARYSLSSEDLAERIGVSKDTVDNAENEVSSLEAVTLFSIAYAFGEEAIEPVRQLYLCAPTEETTAPEDAAEIAALAHRLVKRLEGRS
jgi:DNA-binding XRE family transcriptional regulator